MDFVKIKSDNEEKALCNKEPLKYNYKNQPASSPSKEVIINLYGYLFCG